MRQKKNRPNLLLRGVRVAATVASDPPHRPRGILIMARAPRISLAWSNINKTLPLRAVVFDARCILRSPEEAAAPNAPRRKDVDLEIRKPEKLLAEGKIKDMLRTEIREELVKRGLSSVGKPWEIKERLQAAVEADGTSPAEGTSPAPAPTPPPTPPPLPTPSAGSSPAEKRAAYAAKLRLRTGGSVLRDGTIVANDSPSGGRKTLAADERPADSTLAGSSWHLQSGAREILTYCDMRGILRALLPFDVDSDEAAIAQGAQLARALQVPEFCHVLSLDDAAATRRGEPSAIVQACAALELDSSSNLMLVSDEKGVLRAARAARTYSCFFVKRLPGAPSRLPADFHADDMRGLQHAIEDVNGVTFRDADTEIRSKFGVYQT